MSEQATLPFGTALGSPETTGNPSNRRFTSYDRSGATKLDYAVNRSYASWQGRFTQVDPIGMGAVSVGNPQSLNLYGYVENDPVNFVDPSGLNSEAPQQACKTNAESDIYDGTIGKDGKCHKAGGDGVYTYIYIVGGGGVSVASVNAGAFSTGGGGGNLLDGIQLGLDIIGLCPGLGEIADGANALISLGRGDYAGAALSAGAMIPFAGWGATGLKLGKKGANFVNPSTVKFSQPTVSMNFSDGRTINDTISGLRSGSTKVTDIPAIRVAEYNGELVTLDNRRLLAFQQAGTSKIPVQMVSLTNPKIAENFFGKLNPLMGGNMVVVLPSSKQKDCAMALLRQYGKIK